MNVVYPRTWWSAYLTDEDMECALIDFGKWWHKAAPNLPHMHERVRVAQLAISKPEHIGILVNIVADAYRSAIE